MKPTTAIRMFLFPLALLAMSAPAFGQQFRMACNGNTVSSFTFNNPTSNGQFCSLTTDTGVSIQYDAAVTGGTWLTIQAFPSNASSPSSSFSGTTPATFSLVLTTTGLATNTTYNANITIRQTSNPANAVTYPVSLILGTGSGTGGTGAVNVTPTTMTANYSVGQAAPASQAVNLTSTNGAAFTYSAVVTSGTFLQVINASVGANTFHSFGVAFNVAGLGVGTYNGNIQVTIPNQAAVNVSVTLTVGGGGTTTGVTFNSLALSFNHAIGNSTNPTGQTISMSSATAFTFTANATVQTPSGGSWLSVNPAFATSFLTNQFFTVNVNPANLPQGTYNGTVQVFIGSQVQNISVTLTVGSTGTGGGFLSQSNFSYTYTNGVLSPASQSFSINLAAGSIYSISLGSQINTATNQQVDFLRFTAPSGFVTAGSPIGVLILSNAANFPAGNYSATATVTAGGQTANLTVNLTVSGSGGTGGTGGYTASPTALTFSYTPGSSQFPPVQTITLAAPVANVSYQVTTSGGIAQGYQWLNAAPFSGSTTASTPSTATITVSAQNPQLLTVGSYPASIIVTIQPPGQASQTINIPVTLNVGTTGSTGGQTTISPSQLTFNYQIGTANPASQVLALNTAQGAISSFTASGATSTGASWLQVSPISGNAPGALAVTANPTGLQPGSYTGTVSVTLSGSIAATTVPVTLNVSNSSLLRTNLTQTNFNYQIGGSVPSGQGQLIDVTSTGTSVTFTSSSTVASPAGGTWLTVSPSSATTPSQVTVGINATGLPAGTYTGTVFLTAQGQAAMSIPVTLTVSAVPLFNTVPSALSFTSPAGSTASQTSTISVSTTGAAVSFTATPNVSSGGNWLSVIQSTPGVLTVTASPFSLGDGTYYGAIIISANGGSSSAANSPVVIPVVLVVGSGGGGGGGGGTGNITLTPNNLTFTQIQGGATPPTQSLTIGSSGGSLNYTLQTSTNTGGTWLSASQVSGVTPGTIQISVNASGLAIGSYFGSIIVSSTGGLNSPQVIPVTVNVVTAPVITANPNAISFTASTTGTSPAPQSLSLTSSAANLNYSVAVTVGAGQPNWLEVTPTSGITPATLTVRANVTNLQPGTYTGTITVNLGLTSPIAIPVTLSYQQITAAQITAVTNAASFLPTAVSPGMIIAIFGSNLGPSTLTRLRLNSAGLVDTNLDGVRVLFDGVASPIVYARNDVVSAVVPYVLAGRATTNLQVEYQGVRSREVAVRVENTGPGVFTTNSQGSGQGAILNNDFSLNGPGNPVARGQFATVYITGEGQTAPAGVDGLISSASLLRRPIANVQVRVGGRNADVIYAGSVPTTLLGLAQISFFIPADAPTGSNISLDVIIGGVASQTGVSMAIR